MRTIPTLTPPAATPTARTAPAISAPAPHWPAAAIMDDAATAGVLHSAWSGDPAVVVPSPPGAPAAVGAAEVLESHGD